MRARTTVTVGLVLIVAASAGCDRVFDAIAGRFGKEVVLSDKPFDLGSKPTRVTPNEPLTILGTTTSVCVVLADDVAKDADIDAEFARLKGGAKITAVLHASDGRDHVWKCGNWQFSPGESANGRLSSCGTWECNQFPPKGTKITAIDFSSDKPLHVLGATWSSTDAFDHVSQPPPDKLAVTSAEYRDLEKHYGGAVAWSSPARTALQVGISNNRHVAVPARYNGTLDVRVTPDGIQLQPREGAIGMGVVTIPTSAVEACSMSCFSNLARSTELLLPATGDKVEFLNSPEVVSWCWNNRIPMATGAATRAWFYKKTPLPARTSYSDQFASRAAYDEQAHQTCMGY